MENRTQDVGYFLLQFVILFGLIMLLCFPAVAADKTVGVIMTGDISYYQEIHKAFLEGMSDQGLGSEKIEILLQTPAPDPMSWTNAVRKYIAYEVDMIVAYGASATLTAMKQTSEIPILFAGVYDPQSMAPIGENVTGISSTVPIATVIKNLKGISNFSTLGVLFTQSEKDTKLQADEVSELESKFEFHSILLNFQGKEDTAGITDLDALFFTTSSTVMSHIDSLLDAARSSKIATAAILGGGEERGVILTIAADSREQGRVLARMAAKVIRGVPPSELPAEQPKKVDVVIHLGEASGMGLKIPFHLLTSATRVIR